MSRKLRIGVFGGARGSYMMKVLLHHPDAELVAVCDKYQPLLDKAKAEAEPAPEKAPAKRGRKPKAEAAAAPEAAPAKRGRKPKAEPAEAAPAAAEKPARKPRAKKAAKTEE